MNEDWTPNKSIYIDSRGHFSCISSIERWTFFLGKESSFNWKYHEVKLKRLKRESNQPILCDLENGWMTLLINGL